jgi:hypothetical protein
LAERLCAARDIGIKLAWNRLFDFLARAIERGLNGGIVVAKLQAKGGERVVTVAKR